MFKYLIKGIGSSSIHFGLFFLVWALPMAIGGFGHTRSVDLVVEAILGPMVVVRPPLAFLKYFLIFYYFDF
jgi:hypothetical protein